ncbi:MAG: zinc-ribbon domain-containing protein [Euryarchaeota archaeon]|nr:zinc-ribbon domain-containing protein [Euryarchaeota archaeon]
MVYCQKCGMQNEEDAEFCSKCGATLKPDRRRRRHRGDACFGQPEERSRDECFGIPHGGLIVGMIFGAFLIAIGLSTVFGINLGRWIGPFIIVVVGLLIIVGAILAFRRRTRD